MSKHDWTMLRPRSAEWNAAWKAMAKKMGDDDCEALDTESGEVWQYVGSVRSAKTWEHEFRHRSHPRTHGRILLSVRATRGWNPNSLSPRGGEGRGEG